MILKEPVSVDNSHWRPIPDWTVLVPAVYLGITKATESIDYVDPTFVDHMQGMQEAGIHRGCFHFHRKAKNPVAQAVNFCTTIRPEIDDKTLLILDVEEGGESAAKLKLWFEEVMRQFPHNQVMLYSSKLILSSIPLFMRGLLTLFIQHPLNAIQMTMAERDFFKRIPVWTAGYPYNPDLYDSVPPFYIPDQTKWGAVLLWQYTNKGILQGAPPVDCNWVSLELIAILGPVNGPTDPPDTVTDPYPGLKRISGTRHGWKFELFITDPAHVRYESVCLSPLETVSSVAARKDATLAVNGGEWDRVDDVKDYTITNGYICHGRAEAVPSLMILNDGTPFIDHRSTVNVVQALSGLRYLIRDGVIQSYLSGSEPQYTEGHARSIHGTDARARHMVLQSTGAYPNQGLTLKQGADIMQQYGAVTAFDSGGGGDVTCVFDGQSLIVPENPGGAERALPNVFLINAKKTGEPMPTEDYYKYTPKKTDASDSGSRAIRTGPGATYPRIENGGANSYLNYGNFSLGGATPADRVLLDETTAPPVQGYAGDVWVKVYDNDGIAVTGWVALKHKGILVLTEELVIVTPEPEPPTAGDVRVDKILRSDHTITGTWTDV